MRCDNDFGAFLFGELGGGKTDTGRASDHYDFLACECHFVSSILLFRFFNPSLRGALATKQSISHLLGEMDCFASFAMTGRNLLQFTWGETAFRCPACCARAREAPRRRRRLD